MGDVIDVTCSRRRDERLTPTSSRKASLLKECVSVSSGRREALGTPLLLSMRTPSGGGDEPKSAGRAQADAERMMCFAGMQTSAITVWAVGCSPVFVISKPQPLLPPDPFQDCGNAMTPIEKDERRTDAICATKGTFI